MRVARVLATRIYASGTSHLCSSTLTFLLLPKPYASFCLQEPGVYSGLFCSWNGTGTFTSVP
jgi:hypothetical protein